MITVFFSLPITQITMRSSQNRYEIRYELTAQVEIRRR